MDWYYYIVNKVSEQLPAVETITVTNAWLKALSMRFQDKLLAEPELFLDAVAEELVVYPTVHKLEHFEMHYEHALGYFVNQGFQLDSVREAYVMWLPGEYGYTTCAFLFPIHENSSLAIISPLELDMNEA